MLQRFKKLSDRQIALLIFAISFVILYSCRFPYIIEGDTVYYLTRMEKFARSWSEFWFATMSMIKHFGYLMFLGCFKIVTPFLSSEGTVTLFSTLFSSLTVTLTYLLAVRIFKDRKLAVISSAILFSIRMFLYFSLLGEQYTFQSFLMMLTFLLIYDGHVAWAGVVLGLSLTASPSCGYPILAFMYLIWNRTKSILNEIKIWIIPITIFGPVLYYFYDAYHKNVGWTLWSWGYDMMHGGFETGLKIVGTQMVDNFVVFIPFLILGVFLAYKHHRTLFWVFILSVVPASPLIIGGAVTKWYVPMFPLFAMCVTIPFKRNMLRKLFPLLLVINIVTASAMMLIPVYFESINQRTVLMSITPYKPMIMRWSSGMFYELYAKNRTYYDILDVEVYPEVMEQILDKYGYVYLYDYMEVQCRPDTTLYGLFLKYAYNNKIVNVKERMQMKFDLNYTIFKEYSDGTIIWKMTRK